MMITTIIFDLDGVLDDSYEMHYEYSRKKFTNLTREEHRKLFEGKDLFNTLVLIAVF